jgi:hypothetical protein
MAPANNAVDGADAATAGAGGGQQQQPQQEAYPVKRFVYVIANVTALSGLLFGCVRCAV